MLERVNITRRQREILQNSLGLNRSTIEFRNHFACGPADRPDVDALVAAGLMEFSVGGRWPIFKVTDDGRKVAKGEV